MTISSKPVYGVTGEKPSQDIGVFIKRGGVVLSAFLNFYKLAPVGLWSILPQRINRMP
jgi:hypothetical protein